MKTITPNIWTVLLRLVLLAFFVYLYQFPVAKIISGEYDNLAFFLLGF
jgi:hypothetical protein